MLGVVLQSGFVSPLHVAKGRLIEVLSDHDKANIAASIGDSSFISVINQR